jgi:hypothetical protein
MKFQSGHSGSKSFIGGQPSHIPTFKPWSSRDDKYFGFTLQIFIGQFDEIETDIEYIQLYQSIEVGDDPTPEIVLIPKNAELNTGKSILENPNVNEWDISFEIRDDPDLMPELTMSDNLASLFDSKILGIDPWLNDESNLKFIGQISENPSDLNFGGVMCSLYLENRNNFLIRMN